MQKNKILNTKNIKLLKKKKSINFVTKTTNTKKYTFLKKTTILKNNLKFIRKRHFKLKKKWRFWRGFKQFFINKKKITFYKKLQWNFNEKRLIWHQMIKSYLPNIKNILSKDKSNKKSYVFFLKQLELRLPIILLRSKFYTKLINSYNGIKNSLILINGIIITRITYILQLLDLYQKKRHKNIARKKSKKEIRFLRLKWRKFRWKKARYIFWKIRRLSHFNLFLNKKVNSSFNYLEINYKIPAGVIIKQPFMKEFLINQNTNIISHKTLKKIFFLY